MRSMEIHRILDKEANFSDFFENPEHEFCIELTHKAKIDINEAGATATASIFCEPIHSGNTI